MTFLFFNDTATTEIYTLSLHDALPIYATPFNQILKQNAKREMRLRLGKECRSKERFSRNAETDLVCRLLLEKKKKIVAPSFNIRSTISALDRACASIKRLGD